MAGNPIGFPEIATAIGQRWKSRGLDATIKGGIWSNSPPERTERPYCIIGSLGDVPTTHTTKARYDDIAVTLEIVADNMDALKPLLGAVKAAMGEDALTVVTDNGAVFLKMFPGRVTYLEEANYLRAICEYTVKIKQNRVS
jgi:hypothetical protein